MRRANFRSSRLAPLLLLAVLPAACGGDDGARPDVADAHDTGGDGGCPATGETLDLVGTWAGRAWVDTYMVTAGGGIVHLCPDPAYGVAVITMRIVVREQTGTAVRHGFNVCRLDVPPAEAAVDPSCETSVRMQLGVGPVLTRMWPGIDYPGSVALGGTTACSSYRADPLVAVFGTDGTIGATETLPAWRDGCSLDPARCVEGWEHVVDSDGDGHPGVTLTVDSDPEGLIEGEAYTAFRTVDLLHGTAWTSSLILGQVDPTMDYRLLDSDVRLSGTPMPTPLVTVNIPIFEIPVTGSTFALVRVDGRHGATDLDADDSGEVTCDEILAAESVFTPYQP